MRFAAMRFTAFALVLFASRAHGADEWRPDPEGSGDFGYYAAGVFKGRWFAATETYRTYDGKTWGDPFPLDLPEARAAAADDALPEVNRQRAARGLSPYRRCPLLTAAAAACARFRAARGIHGHVTAGMGDFAFVPAGCQCAATGAEYQGSHGPGWVAADGWGACATFDGYREAGAAWVVAPNGQMYCSLFLR